MPRDPGFRAVHEDIVDVFCDTGRIQDGGIAVVYSLPTIVKALLLCRALFLWISYFNKTTKSNTDKNRCRDYVHHSNMISSARENAFGWWQATKFHANKTKIVLWCLLVVYIVTLTTLHYHVCTRGMFLNNLERIAGIMKNLSFDLKIFLPIFKGKGSLFLYISNNQHNFVYQCPFFFIKG